MIGAVLFDAYGTLLDVHSAMARNAERLGAGWESISRDWRSKQLEYTWIHSAAGRYFDFETITRDALAVTAARHGVEDRALLDDLLAAYRALDAYPDVPPCLRALRQSGVSTGILSNGTPAMLGDGLAHAGIAELLDPVLSVDALRVYKPDPRVYQMAVERLGLSAERIGFVSSNAWDAYGAHVFGLNVCWVNRSGQAEEYGLGGATPMVETLAGIRGAFGLVEAS